MDKKKYNQMGFDFGDADPAQDSPAAGFRIKSLKPASKADAGEPERNTDQQKNLTTQSGANGVEEQAPSMADDATSGNGQTGMVVEPGPAQQSENNPNNDSEVIENTPPVAATGSSEEETKQEQPVAEEAMEAPVAAAPEAEELKAVNEAIEEEKQEETAEVTKAATEPTPSANIPSRLTRPTQVYAVEEKEPETVTAKNNDNIGFTPSSQELGNAVAPSGEAANGTPEEEAANAEQLPVVNNEPVAPSITAAEEPAQTYNAMAEQAPSEGSVETEPAREETFLSEDPGHGVNFNTPEPEPELPKKSTRGRKSLKTLDAEAGAVNIPEDSTLFKRQYYSIGEVAGMFGVNQSLLRFWENEFDIIQPRKNRKGDRHFRPVDIKNLELIYDLLRRRKLTIEGAKEFLKKNKQARERFEMIQSLQQIKGFLLEIKATL